jgi:hypothetical protein
MTLRGIVDPRRPESPAPQIAPAAILESWRGIARELKIVPL